MFRQPSSFRAVRKRTVRRQTSADQTSPAFQATHSFRTEADRARGAALRLLSLKPRTVSEIRERLGRRFDSNSVEQVVSRLLSEGLLNDAEYAQQWRDSRERRKPRSPRLIARELNARGISGHLIENALEGYDSMDAARRAASRYAARQSASDRVTFDRRVGAFLDRRGFEPDVIRKVLQELREELNISGPLLAETEAD